MMNRLLIAAAQVEATEPRGGTKPNSDEQVWCCHVCPDPVAFSELRATGLVLEKNVVTITASGVADITLHAQRSYAHLGVPNPFPADTRFFAVTGGAARGLEYLWAPLNDDQIAALAEQSKPLWYAPRRSDSADKVETREIAAKVGGLAQPRYFDLRNPKPRTTHRIQFAHVEFDRLPIETFVSGEMAAGTFVFEGLDTGFVLFREGGEVKIRSQNSHFAPRLIAHGIDTPWTASEIRTLLREINFSDYFVEHFTAMNSPLYGGVLAERLLEIPDGKWYLKHPNGKHGSGVLKIEIENGKVANVKLPQFEQETVKELVGLDSLTVTPDELLHALTTTSHKGLVFMGQLMLEATIPMETHEGIRGEPRYIFTFEEGVPVYVLAYSKVAEDEVVANRAQGGTSESLRTTFERILRARIGATGTELEGVIEETTHRLREQLSEFARKFATEARARDYFYGPAFAVDVGLTWNEIFNRIEPMLIEVQSGPQISGAEGKIPANEHAHLERIHERERHEHFGHDDY